MRVYGVIGWKNSGKTSLMERLVAEITRRGFSVSTVKHVHHAVDLDQPGKDTFRHRAAGAREVVLASADRFALMVEHRGPSQSCRRFWRALPRSIWSLSKATSATPIPRSRSGGPRPANR